MKRVKEIRKRLLLCLQELRLPAIREYMEDIIKGAENDSLSYREFLYELLEIECASRKNRKVERLLRQSQLPLEKKVENFDLKRMPLKTIQQVKTLMEGLFLERKENILVFGKPGTGKTHLVCAIAQEQIQKGHKVFFSTCSLLVQELLKSKKDFRLPQMLKKLSKYEAIIIDDIGYVQQNREEMEVLFTLLAERYERGSMMITSNLPFSKWDQIFKDTMTTAAVIDRLVHHSIILELNNVKSYRMEAAKLKK